MKYVLTDTAVKNAKKKEAPYKLSDGGGLFVLVSTSGAKLWRYKYRINGKEGLFSLGAYPELGLQAARKEHARARQLVDQGVHPRQQRETESLKKQVDAENTFKAVAKEWIEKKKDSWSGYYLNQVNTVMDDDVFPKIGPMPIKQVTSAHLLAIVKAVEKRGAPTVAINIRQWCSQISRYAISNLLLENDPAAALRGAVKRPKVNHNKSLPANQLATFRTRLSEFGGYRVTAIAMELLLLTFVRTGELRKAEWTEFDLENGIWEIPAERMKMKAKHLVPLSLRAVELLKELHTHTGGRRFLFPNNRRPKECMSATTINRALERMKYTGQLSAHGFRGTASTILHEQGWHSDVIERQLAHAPRNKVKAAYNHAEYWADRKKMMEAWSGFVMSQSSANKVVSIGHIVGSAA